MKFVDLRGCPDIASEVEKNISRHTDKLESVSEAVREIIANVRLNKDKALKEYAEKFDGVKLDNLKVSEKEIQEAWEKVDGDILEILKESKKNIERYHSLQHFSEISLKDEESFLGQKVTPIERVGLYIPGGKSPYPSTVLMNAIPAKIAGVGEIAMVTPPNKEGLVNPYILAAAKLCGVSEIYKVGGAQAIAALAYGTESIKRVHKICGPGNMFVACAKKEVYGDVAIDMIAGPSEILVIADKTAEPKLIACDLLSQAEHDENAACILVTNHEALIEQVKAEIQKQLEALSKKEIAKKALDNFGYIFLTDNIEDAFKVSNEVAPEHLELLIQDFEKYIEMVKNAGTVFLGSFTPEPVGDYFAGSNHTIPTGGKAKFYSPLSAYDFMKRTSIVHYSQSKLKENKDKIIKFAKAEGLIAHAKAVEKRFED